jgi:hypothetical protein
VQLSAINSLTTVLGHRCCNRRSSSRPLLLHYAPVCASSRQRSSWPSCQVTMSECGQVGAPTHSHQTCMTLLKLSSTYLDDIILLEGNPPSPVSYYRVTGDKCYYMIGPLRHQRFPSLSEAGMTEPRFNCHIVLGRRAADSHLSTATSSSSLASVS